MTGKRKSRLIGSGLLAIAGILAVIVVSWIFWRGARGNRSQSAELDSLAENSSPAALDRDTESRIVAFCSDCHTMPRAESFPRDRWHVEVQRGYEFYARSGRNDLDPPPMQQTVAYYRSRAPREVVFPRPAEAETELPVRFSVEKLTVGPSAGVCPEISHLRWLSLKADAHPIMLFCDMRFGYVAAADLRDKQPNPRILARLNHPCHVELCDLDADKALDLVVADLGSSRPSDHDRGRVVWLRGKADGDSFEEVVVAAGLGRVADARPADFDGDGDLDLVVAEFGHYQTGRILLLRNVAEPGQPPRFETDELDHRPGTIHMPVHDFNSDGRPDFVALVSQEIEHVEAFLNRGDGRFRMQTLWAGPDLTFGSSGIELVDLDQDGDMDVLYTNGDAWDNWYASPWHGIQWLENHGNMKFECHRLTDMPGAYHALAGDIDRDGDLDIIAVAWLPPPVMPKSVLASPLASVVCLEQTQPGVFVRHTLEAGSPCYATLELADFDGDGDLDFAVGPGPHVANTLKEPYWLAIWRNTLAGSK